MARTLTKKQRGFVNDYAETGNGTVAALKNYDTDDSEVAKVIASQNLTKPQIQEELKALGFDSNNARRVVGEILNDGEAEHKDRLKASEIIFKVHGDFAPEKTLNVNVEAGATERIKKLADMLNSMNALYPDSGTQGKDTPSA